MKNIYVVFTSFILLITCDYNTEKNISNFEEKSMYTLSINGLIIRSAPSFESPKIAVIPFNEKITSIASDSKIQKYGSLSGNFIKIKWKNYEGYVFSPFLTENKIDLDYPDIDPMDSTSLEGRIFSLHADCNATEEFGSEFNYSFSFLPNNTIDKTYTDVAGDFSDCFGIYTRSESGKYIRNGNLLLVTINSISEVTKDIYSCGINEKNKKQNISFIEIWLIGKCKSFPAIKRVYTGHTLEMSEDFLLSPK
jgi:hypothetical protein